MINLSFKELRWMLHHNVDKIKLLEDSIRFQASETLQTHMRMELRSLMAQRETIEMTIQAKHEGEASPSAAGPAKDHQLWRDHGTH